MRRALPNLAGFEDGGRGLEPRQAGASESWHRQVNGFSSSVSRKEHRLADILTLAQ